MPHPSVLRVRVFLGVVFFDAQSAETILWAWRPSLRHVQLLSAAATSGNRPCARSVCEDPGRDSDTPRFSSDWICGDARARPPDSQRAGEKDSVDSIASAEAKNGANAAEETKENMAGQMSLRFEDDAVEEPHFWQRRFYDFNIWSEKKLREKLEYIHANPVQRKLVLHPREWPWSSWAYYAKGEKRRIRIDPA
ncbi:MAG TPA: hypothetical protein VGI46_08470 [Candidatus Acidoferrum sp.]